MESLDPIETRVGWVAFGEYEHFGMKLYADFLGKCSFLGLAAFSLTGKVFTAADVALLDDIAVCMHCPEPRVWPAKFARLVASSGRFSTGMLAGWATLDSEIGLASTEGAASLLVALRNHVGDVEDPTSAVEEFIRSREELPGFGVHGRRVDERVDALRSSIGRHARGNLPYWRLAEVLWKVAHRERNLDPSFFAAVCAAMLDLGIEARRIPPLLSLLFQPSYLAHTVEGADLKSPSLRHLPETVVAYVGAAPRRSPRALALANSGSR